MKIDLLKYKRNLPALENYLKSDINISLADKLTSFSVSSNIPLIVVAYYILKINGENKEISETIERLKKFYKYDEILGVEELFNGDSN